MRTTNPRHIIFNNLSRISELRRASALAAAILSISAVSAHEDIESFTPNITASHGVELASNISSTANGASAQLFDYNDMVVIDLGRIVSKGESYQITWKKQSGSKGSSKATLQVMESGTQSNFSPQKHLPQTAENQKFITSEFKANSDVRFIMINVASPIDDAIEIDAVSSFTNTVSSSKKVTPEKKAPVSTPKKEKTEPLKKDIPTTDSGKTSKKKLTQVETTHYSLVLCGLKNEEFKLEEPMEEILYWNIPNSERVKVSFLSNEEKTGDPPEKFNSYSRIYSKLEIRPPPI